MAPGDRTDDPMMSARLFATTHWSVVLSAGHHSSPDGQDALEQLCRAYWYPLYAFLRRSGRNEADAQDLIQSFFASLIERDWVATADPAKGRFPFLGSDLDILQLIDPSALAGSGWFGSEASADAAARAERGHPCNAPYYVALRRSATDQ